MSKQTHLKRLRKYSRLLRRLKSQELPFTDSVLEKIAEKYNHKIEEARSMLDEEGHDFSGGARLQKNLEESLPGALDLLEELLVRAEIGEFERKYLLEKLPPLANDLRRLDMERKRLEKDFGLLVDLELEERLRKVRGYLFEHKQAAKDGENEAANGKKSGRKGKMDASMDIGASVAAELELPEDWGLTDTPDTVEFDRFDNREIDQVFEMAMGESLLGAPMTPVDGDTGETPDPTPRYPTRGDSSDTGNLSAVEKPTSSAVTMDERLRKDMARAALQQRPDLPVLRVITGQDAYFIPLKGKQISIGRLEDNDIVLLDDSAVSRYHTQVDYRNGSYFAVDLRSSNGTQVNGVKVKSVKLQSNDVITVGRTKIMYISTEEDINPFL